MTDFQPTHPADTPAPIGNKPRGIRVLHFLASKKRRWLSLTAAGVCAVIGISLGMVTSSSKTAGQPLAVGSMPGGRGLGGGASNARSGPAAGGASGTVSGLSASGFTITTSTGQKVSVDEASSTTYQNGTSSISASAITTGESVLVLGTTNGTTIAATQVTVQPGGESVPSSAAAVVPFQAGSASASNQVGQIPANWSQGSGTIVSGTAANQATKAALASYPGGIVDRVVQLSNGEYNVHMIGVNWPHHVFVNQGFAVVGAL